MELSKAELIKFLTCIVNDHREGFLSLNLSSRDIGTLRMQYKVETLEAAKTLLAQLKSKTSTPTDKLVAETRAKERAARERSTQRERRELERNTKVAKKAREKIDANAIKAEDRKRQERFDKRQATSVKKPKAATKAKAWQLPDDVEPHYFQHMLINQGVRFVCDKFSIGPADIRNEVLRLKLKINWELVRR